MYHKLLTDPTFHALLKAIDDDLAEISRKATCSECAGALHQSNYPRTPFGLPTSCRGYYATRRSFCCGGCRKRFTSPSVRFFGRHRFPAAVIVLLSFLRGGVTAFSLNQVRRYFGITVSKRTGRRWRRWWRECFMRTPFWRQAKGILPIECLNDLYPRSFLRAYSGAFKVKLVRILQFLAPLTAGIYRAV